MAKQISQPRLAQHNSPAYAAGEYLYKNGPKLARQLFAVVQFGGKNLPDEEALQHVLSYGWLVVRGDKIDISSHARAHFDALAGIEPVQPVGQIAAARTSNVFASPGLSKKYIPNPRGTRQDIPEWSVRTGASFHTKA